MKYPGHAVKWQSRGTKYLLSGIMQVKYKYKHGKAAKETLFPDNNYPEWGIQVIFLLFYLFIHNF